MNGPNFDPYGPSASTMSLVIRPHRIDIPSHAPTGVAVRANNSIGTVYSIFDEFVDLKKFN